MARTLTARSVENLKPNSTKRLELPDAVLPGLYLVIQPSGAKSWAVRYRYGGKTRKLTLGPYPALDLAVARERGRHAIQTLALGHDPGREKAEANRRARDKVPERDQVSAVVENFIERHAKRNTKERSAEEAERIFRKHVLPAWGQARVQEITRGDVLGLLDQLVDSGRPVLANRTLAHVRKFFNWCLDRSILEASPCARIAAPSVEKSRDRVLSDAELRLVWKAAKGVGPPFGPFVQLLVLTGQRRDEVAGMCWSELNAEATAWTIPGERTKNSETHNVPLTDAAQAVLNGIPRLAGSDLVFTTTGTTPISGYSNAKERLDSTMLKIASEEVSANGSPQNSAIPPWRLHDIRRTAASGMARLGTPVHVIEAILNHRSGQVSGVAAIYNRHNYFPEKRKALEAWADFVAALVTDQPARNVIALLHRR
jgi:integrase